MIIMIIILVVTTIIIMMMIMIIIIIIIKIATIMRNKISIITKNMIIKMINKIYQKKERDL